MPLPHAFAALTTAQLSFIDDNDAALGALTVIPCTAVGTNALALTPLTNTPTVASYANYQLFSFVAAATSTGAVTININSLGAKNLYLPSGAAAGSGALVNGTLYAVAFNSALAAGAGGFQIVFGASASTAQASGVKGSFKNLSIANGGTPASQVAVTCDELILEDNTGATFKATTVNLTISTLASGINGIDTGSVATSTFYSVWVIYNGTTVAGLLSTSATTPTLPGGYTYLARVGWTLTDGSSNLKKITQKGRQARYVGASLPIMDSGAKGSTTVPTWTAVAVAAFVPTTATMISIVGVCSGASAVLIAAPNNSFGAYNTTTNTPPLDIVSSGAGDFDSRMETFLLESTNIYWASAQTGNVLLCYGWEDNL